VKTVLEVTKTVVVTTAVYTYLGWAAVSEVRHALTRRVREKYVQRPIDF